MYAFDEQPRLRIAADERPRLRNVRTARTATDTRVRHNVRSRYSAIVRFSCVLAGASGLLLAYVMLTSNLTGITYAVTRADAQRTALQEQTGRLDDRLAALESQDRLATLAARLGMREPQQFALVHLPSAPAASDARLAVLTSFAKFLR